MLKPKERTIVFEAGETIYDAKVVLHNYKRKSVAEFWLGSALKTWGPASFIAGRLYKVEINWTTLGMICHYKVYEL